MIGFQLFQYRIHLANALPAVRVTRIDQVQNQISFARFLQRRPECRNQLMRQITHKANRICKHDMFALREIQAAHSGIQRRKKLILDVDIGASQGIE